VAVSYNNIQNNETEQNNEIHQHNETEQNNKQKDTTITIRHNKQ
jgi:hypothetical protein